MQIFLTIIAGVSVYVLGQFILRIIIEPIQELRKEIQLVISNCIYYEDIVLNMPNIEEDLIKEASITLRKRSSELESKASIVPLLDLFSKTNIVPNHKAISDISSALIGLSNVTVNNGDYRNNGENYKRLIRIEELLNIKRNR